MLHALIFLLVSAVALGILMALWNLWTARRIVTRR